MDALVAEAQEEARKKAERNREICAKIEAQILVRKEWERNMKIIFQPPKPKKVETIDLAAIADTEDDDDGANPQIPIKHLFEKTDSIENLVRRVRGL